MSKTRGRDVSPILRFIREKFLGRENVSALRFPDELSAKTQPPPNLPEGPHHKLANNYYYTRDARRKITRPLLVAEKEIKRMPLPKDVKSEVTVSSGSAPIPGVPYKWD